MTQTHTGQIRSETFLNSVDFKTPLIYIIASHITQGPTRYFTSKVVIDGKARNKGTDKVGTGTQTHNYTPIL